MNQPKTITKMDKKSKWTKLLDNYQREYISIGNTNSAGELDSYDVEGETGRAGVLVVDGKNSRVPTKSSRLTHNRGDGLSSRKVGPPKYVLPSRKANPNVRGVQKDLSSARVPKVSNSVVEKMEDIKKSDTMHSRETDSFREFSPSKSDLDKQPTEQARNSFRIYHQRLNEYSRFKSQNGHGRCLFLFCVLFLKKYCYFGIEMCMILVSIFDK